MKSTKQKIWIIIDRKGSPNINTWAFTKKDCINNFIGDAAYSWSDLKEWGWNCVKAELIIQPSKSS